MPHAITSPLLAILLTVSTALAAVELDPVVQLDQALIEAEASEWTWDQLEVPILVAGWLAQAGQAERGRALLTATEGRLITTPKEDPDADEWDEDAVDHGYMWSAIAEARARFDEPEWCRAAVDQAAELGSGPLAAAWAAVARHRAGDAEGAGQWLTVAVELLDDRLIVEPDGAQEFIYDLMEACAICARPERAVAVLERAESPGVRGEAHAMLAAIQFQTGHREAAEENLAAARAILDAPVLDEWDHDDIATEIAAALASADRLPDALAILPTLDDEWYHGYLLGAVVAARHRAGLPIELDLLNQASALAFANEDSWQLSELCRVATARGQVEWAVAMAATAKANDLVGYPSVGIAAGLLTVAPEPAAAGD